MEVLELLDIARACGSLALEMQGAELVRSDKGGGDFATQADNDSEALGLQLLAQRFPNIPVVAEESSFRSLDAALPPEFFAFDPVDGTLPYASGTENWGVTITYILGGRPEAGVVVYPGRGLELLVSRQTGIQLNNSQKRIVVRRPDDQRSLGEQAPERLRLFWDLAYTATPQQITEMVLPLVQDRELSFTRSVACAVDAGLEYICGGGDVVLNTNCKVWDLGTIALAAELFGHSVSDLQGNPLRWDRIPMQVLIARNAATHAKMLKYTRGLD